MSAELEEHFDVVVAAMKRGKVVPFLGSGANRFSRPLGESWKRGEHLPDGEELATYLADTFSYPKDQARELVRVAQFAYLETGSGPLYEVLRKLFNADYPVTPLHQLLASSPKAFRERGLPIWPQLVVTTNYDDVLERALRQAEEDFDVMVYMAEKDQGGDRFQRGKFLHFPPEAMGHSAAQDPVVVTEPNAYEGLPQDDDDNLIRPAILKIHGAVDRSIENRDSYVITEDHYIDYLTHTDISQLIPSPLPERLMRSNFLFLGYSLRDWNLRVILHRIWGERALSYRSWAIQNQAGRMDKRWWETRGVEILNVSLDDYVAELATRVEEIPVLDMASG